ncbi:type IV secretion system DNA-binding domain-containing protein [Labrenzia sp. DG1229]|uniref:type IV secretion system DNA-binding domain-containing protein n=1 Tax=Labrenzia sp. DG1229 TaxID=681847 RepID=UPI0004910829|nr:type IV secretion system DNA-binding domain-containing protein [Labrenzia sp. DG1229]
MIRKPEDAPYRLLILVSAGSALTALVFGWYVFLKLAYVTAAGVPVPMQWLYIKACLNPFDQDYCEVIRATLSPQSAHQFYLGATTFAALILLSIGAFFWLIWEWGLRIRPLIVKTGLSVAGEKELGSATRAEIKKDAPGLSWFGPFQLSRLREVNHFLIYGAIGGGKTQTILPLLRSVMDRGDKAVIFDFKGDYTRMAYSKPEGSKIKSEPLILAPHDKRSIIWDIANDLVVEEDAIEVANRIIPESKDRFFSDSARTILALCIITLMKTKPRQWTWWELMETTQLPLETLQTFAKRYHRDAMIYLNADYRQVAATISTMAAGLGAVRMLAYGWRADGAQRQAFSLRTWLLDEETKDRTLILQRSGRFQDQSEGWISAFLTVMSSTVSDMSFGENKDRRVWLFVDEFAQLPKVHRFEAMLETGRSKGLAVVLGIQGLEQLVAKYSQQVADQIESLIGTKVIAKINVGQTARRLEDQFGNSILITRRQDTDGSGRLKWIRDEKREPAMHRTDFQTELGPLLHKKGVYVLVSGIGRYIYRVLVRYSQSDELRAAEDPATWTTKLREIFDDEEAIARQEDITAQEEMRFGEREPADRNLEIDR